MYIYFWSKNKRYNTYESIKDLWRFEGSVGRGVGVVFSMLPWCLLRPFLFLWSLEVVIPIWLWGGLIRTLWVRRFLFGNKAGPAALPRCLFELFGEDPVEHTCRLVSTVQAHIDPYRNELISTWLVCDYLKLKNIKEKINWSWNYRKYERFLLTFYQIPNLCS